MRARVISGFYISISMFEQCDVCVHVCANTPMAFLYNFIYLCSFVLSVSQITMKLFVYFFIIVFLSFP